MTHLISRGTIDPMFHRLMIVVHDYMKPMIKMCYEEKLEERRTRE